MKVFTIFVNYNSGDQLFKGIKSVLRSPAVSRIIIIDNASKDQSLSLLNTIKTNKIILFKNRKNLGFYKALNIAVDKAFNMGADAVMPLDFDLDFSFDFISKLSKNYGDLIAPVLKFKWGGKWFFDYGGRINWLTGSSYHLLLNKPKNVGAMISSKQHTGSMWFDFVSGGCTIIKKEVFEKIGKFDEDYFVYWGDTDFALRARDAGFKVVLDGKTIVHHKIEISRETRNYRKLRISFFDNLTFIKKGIKWYFKPFAYVYLIWLSIKVFSTTVKSFFS